MYLAMEVAAQTLYTHLGRRDGLLVHILMDVGCSKDACERVAEEILLFKKCARKLHCTEGRARRAICTLGERGDIIQRWLDVDIWRTTQP